jgi:hypothetical protein
MSNNGSDPTRNVSEFNAVEFDDEEKGNQATQVSEGKGDESDKFGGNNILSDLLGTGASQSHQNAKKFIDKFSNKKSICSNRSNEILNSFRDNKSGGTVVNNNQNTLKNSSNSNITININIANNMRPNNNDNQYIDVFMDNKEKEKSSSLDYRQEFWKHKYQEMKNKNQDRGPISKNNSMNQSKMNRLNNL